MSLWWKGRYTLADYRERLRAVPDCQEAVVSDAGHMLHHDQPEALASVLLPFLTA
jgi:pimeloyl-ACP methyl ester carboxylesterase